MKGFILIILAIIAAVLVLGGATAFHVISESGIGIGDGESNSISSMIDKVSNVASSGSSSGGSVVDKVSDIVSEEVKFNAQNGEGYYREVTYKDGGFRQYDTETGDLIGSSYDSDQDKLPSMEWLDDFKGIAGPFQHWCNFAWISFGPDIQCSISGWGFIPKRE